MVGQSNSSPHALHADYLDCIMALVPFKTASSQESDIATASSASKA
jgi:hypothetical protein